MAEKFDQLLTEGIALLETGDVTEATGKFKLCTELEPGRPEGHFHLGHSLAEAGKLEEALNVYQSGLALEPEDTDALTALGDIYFELGKYKDAISAYKKVTEISPRDPDGYVSIGLVRYLFLAGIWLRRKLNRREAQHDLGILEDDAAQDGAAARAEAPEHLDHGVRAVEVRVAQLEPHGSDEKGGLRAPLSRRRALYTAFTGPEFPGQPPEERQV